MLKLPFRTAYTPFVTQEYGRIYTPSEVQSYGMPYHNGVDLVFGDARQTYGTACICPFDTAQVVKVTWDNPTSLRGNGVTIQGTVNGKLYQVVFWHTGEIACKIGQQLKLGDIVCYVGNSGIVFPQPNVNAPWNGAHCHLMLFSFTLKVVSNGSYYVVDDANNGVSGARNPRELFDFTQWTIGQDTSIIHDAWVLPQWIKNLNGKSLVDYFKKIKFW